MTKDELEQIQLIIRQWMSEPTTRSDSLLTIPSGIVSDRAIVIEIKSLLTFDNVLIESAVDTDSGLCYTKRIGPSGKPGEFIDTPFEMLPGETAPTSEPALPANFSHRAQQPAIEPSLNESSPEVDSDPERPKFLLYSNQTLLGHSFLEQTKSSNERKGRFHPSDDYFDYSQIFEAFPQAENDWMELNAREAYGLTDDDADAYRNRFNELINKIEALKLYLADATSQRIETKEVTVEDLSYYYDDQRERWLYVTFAK